MRFAFYYRNSHLLGTIFVSWQKGIVNVEIEILDKTAEARNGVEKPKPRKNVRGQILNQGLFKVVETEARIIEIENKKKPWIELEKKG